MIIEGKKWTEEKIVEEKDSAINMKSGTLPVFSTPSMAAFMEYTAWKSLAEELEQGQTSVGIHISIDHQKGTLIGEKVTATATIKKIENQQIFFEIEVFSKNALIGKAKHIRFIVDKDRFMEKLTKQHSDT